MTLLLVIGAAIFTLTAAYHLFTPFLSSREEQLRFEVLDGDLRRVEELVSRKSTLLQTLRDVEFDYQTDKISAQDYHDLKQRYERQAVQVMRRLDDIHGGRGWETAIDEQLADRVAALKAHDEHSSQSVQPPNSDGPSGRMTGVICPECGKEMESAARFCSHCGTTLADGSGDSADAAPRDASGDVLPEGPQSARQTVDSPSLPASSSEVAT